MPPTSGMQPIRRHAAPAGCLRRALAPARLLAAPLALALLVGLAVVARGIAPRVAAAEPEYPDYDSRYHTNQEMVDEIHATEAAYPDLVDVRSIGTSYEGRDIWVAKVSDNVAVDEDEPEVLVDALHHARERLTLEQALYLLRVLTDEYATSATVRSLVDSREVWIIFSVNPDGHVYDLSGNPYNLWRKNRQPTPGSSSIGTDLNRNYGYRWGCCGGSSRNPAAWNYRGPKAFSAPESRVVRDFVNSRVVGGRQQIRTHITLHTNGELILWPYGYTKTDVPGDMTVEDHRTFVAMARAMADRNGYTAMQSSSDYVTDGDEIDWLYGRHRIFSFTFELYPPEQPSTAADHYSPDEVIARETERNRSALLYAIRMAACPYAAISRDRADCGPLYDDFEGSTGWTVNPDGTDTATAGRWQRGDPAPTSSSGTKQLGTTVSGSRALVTGAAAGASARANDVDGGVTTIRSSAVAVPAETGRLTFRYYLAHSVGSSSDDWLRVWVEAEDGSRTLVLEELGAADDDDASWVSASIAMTPWGGQSVRIVIGVADQGRGNLVEAAVDDIRIRRP